jgi:predicted O-methyltransferase YrrM
MEYGTMHNWTLDVPKGSKLIFEQILDLLKGESSPKILEIGTYMGTSVISMLKHLPGSTAVVIDCWDNSSGDPIINEKELKNDAERIFDENVTKMGVGDRIIKIKGDSRKVLPNLNEMFDFIYIDGSHACLDVMIDMINGWRLLNKGGIMAMDDVLWMQEMTITSPLSIPYHSVMHFLNVYKGEYMLLNFGYRVFIKKI